MGLERYQRKRAFERTPEPSGRARRGKDAERARSFVVQQHAARRMHWDFRLELDGVLKSWAVPKGPSLVAGERRMAVETEDHPLEYATFEGVIPKGEYGAGAVIVWDRGVWEPLGDPHEGLATGKLDFTLAGQKLRGRFHLVRLRPRARERGRVSWLLIKGRDEEARAAGQGAVVAREPRSVVSGLDLEGVAQEAGAKGSARKRRAPGLDPSALPGAHPARLRGGIEPQLATLVESPPVGEEWLHEIKFDGYRLLARIEPGSVRLLSRNGRDWTDRFPKLAAALRALRVRETLLDGEAIVVDAEGKSRFQALQNALGRRGASVPVRLALFDCLHLDGYDLREVPLLERKRALAALLAPAAGEGRLQYSDHQQGRGGEFFAAACEAGLEGTVAKRADAPYRSGRTRSWRKIRCSRRQEFVIVGFSEPRGARVGLGALLLAAHDAGGALRYCGKVGTGFDDAMLAGLRTRLERLERPQPSVVSPPRLRGVHWVEPRLVAEVSFSEWTRDRRVRHPVFLGLREDKPAAEVRIEAPQRLGDGSAAPASTQRAAPARREGDVVAGVRLSTPERVYFPGLGVTKRELAEYYEATAERVLPGLAQRPLTLLRCPEGIEGEHFYQKRANASIPEAVPRVRVRGDREPYAMVSDLASLISLVQVGVLELHVWGARADRLERPDLIVFDLDPAPDVPWGRVRDTALALRDTLAELGLAAFGRVTGGKGLHVVVPLERRSTWDDVRTFSRGLALSLVRAAPAHYTARASKARRQGRIFVDWMRNAPEATAIATGSVRARPGAPVALPLAWDEIEAQRAPLHESLREAQRRLERPDPWADFEASRRRLTKSALGRFAAEKD